MRLPRALRLQRWQRVDATSGVRFYFSPRPNRERSLAIDHMIARDGAARDNYFSTWHSGRFLHATPRMSGRNSAKSPWNPRYCPKYVKPPGCWPLKLESRVEGPPATFAPAPPNSLKRALPTQGGICLTPSVGAHRREANGRVFMTPSPQSACCAKVARLLSLFPCNKLIPLIGVS